MTLDAAAIDDRGEVLWRPTPGSVAASRIGDFLSQLKRERGLNFHDYDELWKWSVGDLPGFWGAVWDYLQPLADGDPNPVLIDAHMPGARWFPGVAINFAENALRGPGDEVVLVARSQTRAAQEWTRDELREAVARARAGLVRLGVGSGDRVAAYLPNIPEAVIAMLATTSLGAVWASCAPELGVSSVVERLAQIEPTVLLAIDGYRYGTKDVDRRAEVQAIQAGLPTLRATVHVDYLHPGRPAGFSWADLLARPADLTFERVAFDHPLWILFSSGTTGLPKAIVHGHGGIVVELGKSHALHADLGPGDRFFVYCTTTWVMWNILASGLLVGASVVLMDGHPGHPDDLELWRIVAETGVTVYGCGASLIVNAARAGLRPGDVLNLTRVKGILCTGSPLPRDGFRWIYDAVSPTVLLQSSSGGTDVCTGFVGGSPMVPVRAGEIACRCLGVLAEALDPDGHPVLDEPGELVISAPMPSMPVCFWNDPGDERYRATYFTDYPGRWRHGDWIQFTADGASRITGRSDGTLNRGGVRLGTAEFYSVLADAEAFPEIDDALVVHLEDPEGGLGTLWLFVALVDGAALSADLQQRIDHALRQQLSPRHRPDRITAVSAIPYNLAGKKLEIPIKRILQGVPRGDVINDGAMRNPQAVEDFERIAAGLADSADVRRGRKPRVGDDR
jgi:acetoacetyl-CoA synthetase